MILTPEHSRQYLLDYKAGKISQGLGIGLPGVDDYIRYKMGQLNMINGLDNVGKTAWVLWYFLCLSVKHNLRWCIWSGENKSGMLVRQLIEMYCGKRINELGEDLICRYETEINQWFTFIDNQISYTNKELYKLFSESECHGALIDPYTGMKRGYNHADNYDFLNETREFVNKTKITVYVNTHPHTEAARRTHTSGEFLGYSMPPSRSQSEGGQPFANRCDDFITLHRYVGHPFYKYKTMLHVRKIKDTETGGQVTAIDEPIVFEWNNGLGFVINENNPLKKNIVDYTEPIKDELPF